MKFKTITKEEVFEFIKKHDPKREIIQIEPFEVYFQNEIKFKNDERDYVEYFEILGFIRKGAEDLARKAGQTYPKLDKFRRQFFVENKLSQ